MAGYMYENSDGELVELRLTAERAFELEASLEGGVLDKVVSIGSLTVATKFIAAMLPDKDGLFSKHDKEYRREKAEKMFDDMVDSGKTFTDFQLLILEVLAAGGFIAPNVVEIQRKANERAAEIINTNLEKISAPAFSAEQE